MTAPDFEVVTRPDLYNQDGQSTFYRVTPVPGGRVEGDIAVGMGAHYARDRWGHPVLDSPWPEMRFELSPRLTDLDGEPTGEREPLRVNGKRYLARFFAKVTLLPAEDNDEREQWHPRVTVDGCDYLLAERFEYYGGLTDSARKVLRPLLQRLAAEYVTAERWREQQVREAVRRYDATKVAVVAKQAELEKAKAESAASWQDVCAVVERFSPRHSVDSA